MSDSNENSAYSICIYNKISREELPELNVLPTMQMGNIGQRYLQLSSSWLKVRLDMKY